jgi:hypothetical protein
MAKTEKVFVTPGPGRKTPLPLPGGGSVPANGTTVVRTLAIERLIRSKDLVVGTSPAAPAAKTNSKEG